VAVNQLSLAVPTQPADQPKHNAHPKVSELRRVLSRYLGSLKRKVNKMAKKKSKKKPKMSCGCGGK
jgi:hypothetical protein